MDSGAAGGLCPPAVPRAGKAAGASLVLVRFRERCTFTSMAILTGRDLAERQPGSTFAREFRRDLPVRLLSPPNRNRTESRNHPMLRNAGPESEEPGEEHTRRNHYHPGSEEQR